MFNMRQKLKQHWQNVKDYLRQLSDLRVIGLLIFLVVALLISWSGIKVIDSNYVLQQQIAQLQQHDDIQKLNNENLALQNDYYQSNQYLELEARADFGLGAPGETELIVPNSVAMSHTVNLPSNQQQVQPPQVKQPKYQQNFQDWMNFFLHRENNQD
jgi:cell division protein FtsB